MIEGYAAYEAKKPLKPLCYDPAKKGPYDIEIEITHCGICHSDLHLINNDWGFSKYPFIPGHEIIGMSGGKRLGVGWQRSACQTCEFCEIGEQNMCAQIEATCVGHHGGFANKIIVDSRFAFEIPEALASENAAPLLCGGATVYGPLIHQHVHAGSKVGVIGIGGLGHLAIQFASAMGCEVYAFSSSPKKEEEAKGYGAHHFNKDEPVDLLLCTSSAPVDWEKYVSLLRPKGVLCQLGVPSGFIQIPPMQLLDGRKSIMGSNIASPPVIKQMLNFAALHQIKAQTELFPISQVNTALEKLSKGDVRYRAVLEL